MALGALVTAGCSSEGSFGPTFSVSDSAGITVAENRGEVPSDGGGWSISPEPSFQIGAVDGDEAYLLFRVWGATRLSDGRIAVVNNRAPDLRIFSPTGEHLHTFGSRGEGPGEFDSPVLAGTMPGDTLVVVDRMRRRINLFHPEEGFIRVATGAPEIEGSFLLVGMFSSGSIVVQRTVFGGENVDGYSRRPIGYRAVATDGTLESYLGEYPGAEMMIASQAMPQGGTTMLSIRTPFGKSAIAAVKGDRFYFGSQDAYEIRVHDQNGSLLRLIRRDKVPTPVTDAHVAAVMEEMADDAESDDQTRQFRRMFREAPIPETHPAHGAIYADALGYLWVEEYRLPGDDVRHTTIFDDEGRMVGSVVLPNRFRVEEIGADYLLGRASDELGVEYLRLYDLTRPRLERDGLP
jgi:hypothetical protein